MCFHPDTNLPDPFVVGAPGMPTVSESLYITKNGAGVKAKVELNWTAANDAFVNQYEIQYKEEGGTKYLHGGTVSDTDVEILDIAPKKYYFRIRAINALGASSDWRRSSSRGSPAR